MKTITLDDIEYELTPVVKEVFSDWRLPTIRELKTLVNYERCDPASDLEDTASDYYWASSPDISGSRSAWLVGFTYGGDSRGSKSCTNSVRCVRDGVSGLEWSASSTKRMTWEASQEYAKNLKAPVYFRQAN